MDVEEGVWKGGAVRMAVTMAGRGGAAEKVSSVGPGDGQRLDRWVPPSSSRLGGGDGTGGSEACVSVPRI